MRVRGFAVLRQSRVTALPIEIILHDEAAKEIAAGILCEIGRAMYAVTPGLHGISPRPTVAGTRKIEAD